MPGPQGASTSGTKARVPYRVCSRRARVPATVGLVTSVHHPEIGDPDRLAELCEELQATWYEKIPVTNALGVRIASFDGIALIVEADFDANINLHGTAFAGSLYAVNALCGWSMVHLQLTLADLPGSIVLVEGNIRYAAPVRESIVATCIWKDQGEVIKALKGGKKKGRIEVTSTVEQDGQSAACFEGRYAILID